MKDRGPTEHVDAYVYLRHLVPFRVRPSVVSPPDTFSSPLFLLLSKSGFRVFTRNLFVILLVGLQCSALKIQEHLYLGGNRVSTESEMSLLVTFTEDLTFQIY